MLSAARWVSIALHPFVMALVMAGALEVERGIAAAARTVAVRGEEVFEHSAGVLDTSFADTTVVADRSA